MIYLLYWVQILLMFLFGALVVMLAVELDDLQELKRQEREAKQQQPQPAQPRLYDYEIDGI